MSTLKASAEAAIAEVEEWKAAGEKWPQWNVRYIAFRQEATPAKVLELIAALSRISFRCQSFLSDERVMQLESVEAILAICDSALDNSSPENS